MENNHKKIAIIGAGPAGITAAIYVKRAGIEPVIFENYVPGGKVNFTAIVENYPAYPSMSGPDLAMHFYEHLQEQNIDIVAETVQQIQQLHPGFQILTDQGTYVFDAVIVCSGTTEKKLPLPEANQLEHHGISYCAVCDGPLYRGKDVAVIGGGDSALEEAIYLSTFCHQVYLIHRRDAFRASTMLIEKVRQAKNILLLLQSEVIRILGEKEVEEIEILHHATNQTEKIKIQCLFPYIGAKANTSFLDSLHMVDEKGYIAVDENRKTKIPGLFAAGDVIQKDLRQIVTAAGDGAIAGMEASRYVKENDI